MRKALLASVTVLTLISLAGCGSKASKAKSSHQAATSSKTTKHKHHAKQVASSASSSSPTVENGHQQAQGQQSRVQATSTNSGGRQLTQGEINRQRGYDPTGAPLLPGQDHAAGANPDGTPDAWVQGQIDENRRRGITNPDGSATQNYQNWLVDRNNAESAGNPYFPDYDQNQQW